MPEARAQRISDYTLVIDKRGCDAANMRVDCSFRLDLRRPTAWPSPSAATRSSPSST